MSPTDDTEDVEVTADDVGSEGGSPGDVEVARNLPPATGSEAGETWRPAMTDVKTVVRNESGKGRRSP